jgi:hypothetical protein
MRYSLRKEKNKYRIPLRRWGQNNIVEGQADYGAQTIGDSRFSSELQSGESLDKPFGKAAKDDDRERYDD